MQVPRSLATAPIAEIERRIQWRAVSAFVFLGILVSLAIVAILPRLSPPVRFQGLPEDPDVRDAAHLMQDRLCVNAADLQFHATLLGENALGHPYTAADEPAAARAEAMLRRGLARHPAEVRVVAALASLDLARGRLDHAERGYRAALERASGYGEARFGLGLLLALRAEREASPLLRRRRLLQAIAQFAAVDEPDPACDAALCNRALLLARVGRVDEARRVGSAAIARDPRSAWAVRLARELGLAAR